ncbi:MAG: putative restriction endonuclease [Gallionellaceae bacterium]|nr:MAG: putative restriction endonuclease [Gallionellaceae bacterium]
MLNDWLNRLAKLRVDRASKNPAPHKPLLLLAILDQIEEGSITSNIVKLTPELAFRFLGYWEVVSSRGRSVGRAELPFFHLQSDGFLKHVAILGLEAALDSIRPTSVELLNKVISHAELPEEFFVLMQNTDHRDAARKILIAGNWFSPEERIKLLAMLGLDSSDFALDGESVPLAARGEDVKQGRDIKFRLQIVPLYHYSCALCGIKMLLPSGVALVEAAHIHQFAQSKNDDITNGMALCRNHHWAFDQGLWSIDTSFEIVVACGKFAEQAPNQTGLMSYQSKQLDFSWLQPEHRPSQRNLDWHRRHKFIGHTP